MEESAPTYPVYTSGILLAIFSFLALLLIMPPFLWHLQHRNIGATALIVWLMILLLFNFVNALLWPSDDLASWYNGVGLCDIEVKIQVAARVGIPASFACILRGLAAVLDTESTTLTKTRAQRRREYAVDLLWCVGLPLLQMPFHYIVQPHRYAICSVSGCAVMVDESWLTMLLIVTPPAVWVIIDTYFSVLILVRLYRYRMAFRSILAANNTPRSRFVRLYLLCILWVLFSIPLAAFVFYITVNRPWQSYSWSETHNAESWNEIILVQSGGHILSDHWIALALGFGIFVFFGLGKEAMDMYRSAFLAIGLGRLFPLLERNQRRPNSTFSSISSKAKNLFERRKIFSTSTSTSGPTISSISTEIDHISTKESEAFETLPVTVNTSWQAGKAHI